MRRRAAGVTGAAAAALLGLVVGSPMALAASGDLSIVNTDVSDGNVVTVVQLNAGKSSNVDVSSAAMTFDGIELRTSAKPVEDSSEVDQVALLAIDTSGSMRGAGISGAMAAAQSFLQAVPANVRVGLVTISTKAQVAVTPTTDRTEVSQAVDALSVRGSTALYDAVELAARQVAGADLATVLLLSDGANRGGTATLAQATAAAKRSGATFDAVSIGTASNQVAPLKTISAATGGRVTTSAADAGELTAAFDQTAQNISDQYVVTGALPGNLAESSGNVTVSLAAAGTTYTDVAFVQLNRAAPAPAPAESAAPEVVAPPNALESVADRTFWPALAALFLGLLVILAIALTSASRGGTGTGRMRRRLSAYSVTGGSQSQAEDQATALGDSQVARSAVDLANRMVVRRNLETVVGEQLESAGVPLKAAEWMLIQIGIAIGAGLLCFFIFGGAILPTLLGLAAGLAGPWIYLSTKRRRRLSKFMQQLPGTLQLMAGSLAAGYSMPQAVDTVVRDGEPPISSEFNRALVEARLGVPLEDALDGIATRMRSVDFSWVVMAIRIQREVGGNLAEVLNTVAATLRERERLRRQVDVLSAEGRLSAWILGLLPFAFAGYLVLTRPEYLLPLVTDPLGWVLIVVGAVLMVVGILWLRKVVKVEV